jgi:hypothetical protein
MGVVLLWGPLELAKESAKEKRLVCEPFFFDRKHAPEGLLAAVSIPFESL